MAVYPTPGGSPGTWGAETRAFHAVTRDLATGKILDGAEQVSSAAPTTDPGIANKKYVDDGQMMDLNGTPTKVFSKILTGNLAASSDDTIAHGIVSGNTKIMAVSPAFLYTTGTFQVAEMFTAEASTRKVQVTFNSVNVVITGIGSSLQGNSYRIKIDYIL
jgi:hypothetical protein